MKHEWRLQDDSGLRSLYVCTLCKKEYTCDSTGTPQYLSNFDLNLVVALVNSNCDYDPTIQPGKVRVWLDDERKAPFGWVHCTHVDDVKVLLKAGVVSELALDHDLGFTHETDPLEEMEAPTGYDLTLWMAEHEIWPSERPTVHSANPVGAERMRGVIERYFNKKD